MPAPGRRRRPVLLVSLVVVSMAAGLWFRPILAPSQHAALPPGPLLSMPPRHKVPENPSPGVIFIPRLAPEGTTANMPLFMREGPADLWYGAFAYLISHGVLCLRQGQQAALIGLLERYRSPDKEYRAFVHALPHVLTPEQSRQLQVLLFSRLPPVKMASFSLSQAQSNPTWLLAFLQFCHACGVDPSNVASTSVDPPADRAIVVAQPQHYILGVVQLNAPSSPCPLMPAQMRKLLPYMKAAVDADAREAKLRLGIDAVLDASQRATVIATLSGRGPQIDDWSVNNSDRLLIYLRAPDARTAASLRFPFDSSTPP